MPTVIKGQPTSAEVRARLAAEGRPVLVAFSGGKDSIAATLALREDGIETVLAYLYAIPPGPDGVGLRFVQESLDQLSVELGQEIHQYPHPSLYRMLNALVFQPPERCAIIEAAQLPDPTYEQTWDLIREDLGLPADTWCADGVRAADSIVRRASLTRHGVIKPASRKVSVVCDWLKHEVLAALARHGVSLPREYAWFDRSFDGFDRRFLEPLAEHAPDDFQRVLHWFPLAELELIRDGV